MPNLRLLVHFFLGLHSHLRGFLCFVAFFIELVDCLSLRLALVFALPCHRIPSVLHHLSSRLLPLAFCDFEMYLEALVARGGGGTCVFD